MNGPHDRFHCQKVDATAEAMRRIDSRIDLDAVFDRYRPRPEAGDAVFCCVDSISARAAIWRSAGSRCRLWDDGRMRGDPGFWYGFNASNRYSIASHKEFQDHQDREEDTFPMRDGDDDW